MSRLQIYHVCVIQFDTLELSNKFSLNIKKSSMLSFSAVNVSSFHLQFFLDSLCFQKWPKTTKKGFFSYRKSFLILELFFSLFVLSESKWKNFRLIFKNFFSTLKFAVIKKIPFFDFVVKFVVCTKTIPWFLERKLQIVFA